MSTAPTNEALAQEAPRREPAPEVQREKDMWALSRALIRIPYVELEAPNISANPRELIRISVNTRRGKFLPETILADVLKVVQPVYEGADRFVIGVSEVSDGVDLRFLAFPDSTSFVSGTISVRYRTASP